MHCVRSYNTVGQLATTIPLQPASITVQPSPSLVVKYFIDSFVQVRHVVQQSRLCGTRTL